MKVFLTYCLFFMILIVTSCNNQNAPDAENAKLENNELVKIHKRGVINALIENGSTSYFIYKGRPMGFEYELLKRFAKHENLKLNLVVIKNMDSAISMLNEGKGDIIAADLTVTKKREKEVAFTNHLIITKQVLVQRKPPNWRQIRAYKLNHILIRSPIDLKGKTIYVRRNSAFYSRLVHLNEEIGGGITIQTVSGDIGTESLIKDVSDGEINYTIADRHIAEANEAYYRNVDVNTAISFNQEIAWAVQKGAYAWRQEVNEWLNSYEKTSEFSVIYHKYFENHTGYLRRVNSNYYAARSGRLSPYDKIIKKEARKIDWDWKLLASLIYQESNFDPNAESWTGAFGLMQIMPETAQRFGIDSNATPSQNIEAGVKLIKYYQGKWAKTVKNKKERIKFVLASYNVGLGHVIDARNLASKYGKNPVKWDGNVAYFLLHESEPKYYNDPVVKYGYCRGIEPYDYVKEIITRYNHYKNVLSRKDLADLN